MSDARFWPPGALALHAFGTPPFTVAPFLPAGGIGVLHGPPGIGKSQLALTLGLAVATGAPWLAPEYATTPGHVLYVQLDVIPPIQQERVRAANGAFQDACVAFLTSTERFNVMQAQPGRLAALKEAIDFTPALVIVDALRDTHELDENESSTPPAVFGAWRRLFPAATFLFLHHDRKVQVMPGAPERWYAESARGTGAWLAKADCGLHLTDVKGHLTIFFSKVRTCAPQAPLAVALHEKTLLVELTEPTVRQKALAKQAEVAAAGGAWARSEALRYLQTECGCARRTAYRIAEELGLA